MSKTMKSFRGAISLLLLVAFNSFGISPATAIPLDGWYSCSTGEREVFLDRKRTVSSRVKLIMVEHFVLAQL